MNTNARNAYMNASISTATPQRLLIMLFDRLVLDVKRGLEAQRGADYDEAGKQLMHAQEIISELSSSLKVDAWDGGPRLASIYNWLFSELIKANVSRDATVTEACLGIVEPLAETWREAALAVGGANPQSA
jgi:flagellar protein FliS